MAKGTSAAWGDSQTARETAWHFSASGQTRVHSVTACHCMVPQERERSVPAARRHICRAALWEHTEPAG